jgi:general secretion pathway protein E
MAVMAQLSRAPSAACRVAYDPTLEEIRQLGMSADRFEGRSVYRTGPGCQIASAPVPRANRHSRLLVIDDDIRALVMRNADAASIRRAATAKGMSTLREDRADKLLAGVTTVDEILRVTQEDLV